MLLSEPASLRDENLQDGAGPDRRVEPQPEQRPSLPTLSSDHCVSLVLHIVIRTRLFHSHHQRHCRSYGLSSASSRVCRFLVTPLQQFTHKFAEFDGIAYFQDVAFPYLNGELSLRSQVLPRDIPL